VLRAHGDAARFERRLTVLRELVERARPVAAVNEIEIRVARVARDGAPAARVLHAVNDRAVAARGLTETAAVLAARLRAQLAVDERHELARQVVRIAADRARIDVLIAAERRE